MPRSAVGQEEHRMENATFLYTSVEKNYVRRLNSGVCLEIPFNIREVLYRCIRLLIVEELMRISPVLDLAAGAERGFESLQNPAYSFRVLYTR